eukprot:TRINITY_DN61642_c1_g4_i1.p1 TRINITY_DN61642_c1_g4~~TRINITY_DN61642_c1_g4_i1.p1  ORF type:complete len:727 (-),score=80.93 TRINITY_DN61642_c1_g4_i1:42-2222(-)
MAELQFLRHDLMNTASTFRHSCRVLPLGRKHKQKIVIGDSSGTLQCFSLGKSLEMLHSFKMTLHGPNMIPKAVSYIDLFSDKIFVATGEAISGINRKGKTFFRLETNQTERISSMAVQTPYIWTAGEYVLNMFEEGREASFYMSPDKVNHLVVDHLTNDKTFETVLACQDRHLRVVKDGELQDEYGVEGSGRTLCLYSTKNSPLKEILYGTENGVMGSWKIDTKWEKKWDSSKMQTNQTAGFNALNAVDFTEDGVTDLIVGRDNGLLEIYKFDTAPEPVLIYQTSLDEMITSVDTGLLTTTAKKDIALTTYSGKILCFSVAQEEAHAVPIPVQKTAEALKQADAQKKRNEKKVQMVKAEIERLKERLDKKKEEYAKISEDHIAITTDYKVMDKFVLDSTACWVLTIELDCPIEAVALQCDVDVELMELDSTTSIVSKSKAEKESATKLLATYRNTESTNRLDIKVRTVEGQCGTLQAFIVPALAPKTAQATTYAIKPLSLHQRVTEKPAGMDAIALNTLNIAGSFQISDIHSWVLNCLPEIPERPPSDEATMYYRSTFQETILIVKYKAQEASFRSDNISTLSILKERITNMATQRKTQVKVTFDIKDETCSRVLELLHPRLKYQLQLSEKVKLINALQEIEMQEQDISFLSAEYKDILDKAKEIEKEHELQPRRLEFLHGIVRNLFLDKYKFKGMDVRSKLSLLDEQLNEEYTLKKLQDFFSQTQ